MMLPLIWDTFSSSPRSSSTAAVAYKNSSAEVKPRRTHRICRISVSAAGSCLARTLSSNIRAREWVSLLALPTPKAQADRILFDVAIAEAAQAPAVNWTDRRFRPVRKSHPHDGTGPAGAPLCFDSKAWRADVAEDHTYGISGIVGSSHTSLDDAIRNAIKKASKERHNLRWFEVERIRGHLEDGQVGHFQVELKLGYTLED
jgi:flavin-binding protein dodecin